MKKVIRGAGLVVAAAVLCGAKAENVFGMLGVVGLFPGGTMLVAMPFGILLYTWRPALVLRTAEAVSTRRTAALLLGAGGLVIQMIVLSEFLHTDGAQWLVVPFGIAFFAWFLLGFTACSLSLGDRMAGLGRNPVERDPTRDGVRPLVLGWLVRAGAFAVPFLWPVVGCYLVIAALGAPVVALFGRKNPPTQE